MYQRSPIRRPPGGVAALRRYVANLDVMRQLVTTFVRPLDESLPNP